MSADPFAAIEPVLARHGIAIAADARARIVRYAELLAHWNRRINLVGTRDTAVLWQRHLLDCLLLEAVPRPAALRRWVDIGAGAGLPAVLLAICHPGLHVTAVEAAAKKATFLGEAARTLELPNLAVRRADVRTLAAQPDFVPFDAAVARAFGPLAELLALGAALLRPDGELWAMKGRQWQREAAAVPSALLDAYGGPPAVHAFAPAPGSEATVLVYRRAAAPTAA